ncbi:Dicarboxylate/amino acid:cation symporter, partial [Globisporangium splendens]
MRKLSELTPNPSEMSLTPHSSHQQPKLSDLSMHQYEFEMRTDFTCKNKNKFDHGHDRGVPMLQHVDLKEMMTSAYDHTARVSAILIILGAAVGVGLGLVLEKYDISEDIAEWIALPGDLFIDALTCLITPMVFCSVVTCIGELVLAGKAIAIGGRTVSYFALASITSSSIGTIVGALFAGFLENDIPETTDTLPGVLRFQCPNSQLLTQLQNGGLVCRNTTSDLAVGAGQDSLFYLNDTLGFFSVANTTYSTLSVSDQVISILTALVPENLVGAFASDSSLSVISLAFVFGVAVVKGFDARSGVENYPLLLITHANVMLRMMINMVVTYMPIAVVSLVAGAIAQNDSPTHILRNVLFMIVALAIALATVTIGVMGTALFITTRTNIFKYLKHIIPAQAFIFGCSSSIATLPMTMRCVDATGQVSRALSRFVLTLGATSNLNGTAVYMPLACIFLAKLGGYEADLTAINYVMLAIVSSISSLGVAPVPHSGLVMVITVWRTVFSHSLPPAFSILVGTDWILNRMRAIVNITNDTILARIIAEQCDETVFANAGGAFDYDVEDSIMTPPSMPDDN